MIGGFWVNFHLNHVQRHLLVHIVDVSKDHDQVTHSHQYQDMSWIPAGKHKLLENGHHHLNLNDSVIYLYKKGWWGVSDGMDCLISLAFMGSTQIKA